MFKNCLTFILILTSLTTHSFATTHTGLRDAFDEYQYALSVEWDQVDAGFKERQVEVLKLALSTLHDQGLTQEEFIQFMMSELKHDAVSRDIETTLRVVDLSLMSQDEAHAFLTQIFENAEMRGAQWNPAIKNLVISGLVLGAFYLLREIYNRSRSLSCSGQAAQLSRG